MLKSLCLILIFFGLQSAQAFQGLEVLSSEGHKVLCHKNEGRFWSCDNSQLLFLADLMFGQVPTLHSLHEERVEVPGSVKDLSVEKILFTNKSDFQYQRATGTAREAYYRKHNLMMGFEPSLRKCHLEGCRRLKELLATAFQRDRLHFTKEEQRRVDEGLLALLPQDVNQKKTLSDLKQAWGEISSDSSLRYDYLRDGCFARSHVVASQLAARGFEVHKIWVHGFSLWSLNAAKPEDFFGWRYHVAPVVRVAGTLWVLDPGLFSEPVAPHAWVLEVFGPNQKMEVLQTFNEDDLASRAVVAVSLSPWQVYPGYRVLADPVEEKRLREDLNEARYTLEELGIVYSEQN